MSGMDRVLKEVLARPYALKDVSLDSLRQIWGGVGSTLDNTLQNSKVRLFHFHAPPDVAACAARTVPFALGTPAPVVPGISPCWNA